jgi:23S rRNA (uracil-5-)-methyltransferase RumA
VNVGEEIILNITGSGYEGEGAARSGEKIIFIPFALPGEKIRAKITCLKDNVARAKLVEIITKSPDREEPVCPLFGECGGCDYMHAEYSAELRMKEEALASNLKKYAGYGGKIEPIVRSEPLYYRNKLQLPFGIFLGKPALGFYRENSHEIVPLEKCYLHSGWADRLIKTVLDFTRSNNIPVYDEKTGKGLLRHLVARYIDGLLSIILVVNGDSVPKIPILIKALASEFKEFALYLSINKVKNNVVMGDKIVALVPPPRKINQGGISFGLNPLSFLQVNDPIREKIYSDIIEVIKPDKNVLFIDAYGGIGLLGTKIAAVGGKVINIEIIKEAAGDAEKLYNENSLPAENIAGDAAAELPKILSRPEVRAFPRVFVFLDPPRKGLDPMVISALKSLPDSVSPAILYLSCNPATLARDVSLLSSRFSPSLVRPYDMFPRTRHLETLVIFHPSLTADT